METPWRGILSCNSHYMELSLHDICMEDSEYLNGTWIRIILVYLFGLRVWILVLVGLQVSRIKLQHIVCINKFPNKGEQLFQIKIVYRIQHDLNVLGPNTASSIIWLFWYRTKSLHETKKAYKLKTLKTLIHGVQEARIHYTGAQVQVS